MVGFRYVTTITQGFVRNLTDLTLGQVGDRIVLVGATQAGGGLSVWGVVAPDRGASLIESYDYSLQLTHLAEPQAILLDRPGGISLLATGLRGGADAVRRLGADGRQGAADKGIEDALLPQDLLHAGSFILASGQPMIYAARQGEAGFTLWRQQPDGSLVQAGSTTGPPSIPSDAQIDALVPLRIGGLGLVIAASTRGNFVSAHVVLPDGRLEAGEYLGAANGTGFNGPRDIAAVEIDGRHYLVVSSAYSSSLTTVRILPGGGLVPVDHVIDERTTRFQSAPVMETVVIDGRAFVVVGGADDGLSLFTITPDGRLIHLDTIADDTRTALTDVSALAVRVIDGRIVVFAGSEVEAGVSQFVIDPGRIGVTRQVGTGAHVGTDGNDLIQGGLNTTRIDGGAGDDILIVGSRSITLQGGSGSDLFVLLPVAGAITIADYEPGVDRLDLSMLGMIRSTQQLQFVTHPWGVRIRFGETIVDVRTRDGRSLSGADFDNSMFPITHYQPPDVGSTILGTSTADVLRAAKGGSTIYGYNGNDTIFGSQLEDFVIGGAGDDSIVTYDGRDTVWGGAGHDVIRTGAMDDLVMAGEGDDFVFGEDGDDMLTGETGNDRIYGGRGKDRINGGPGDDFLAGEDGDDRLFGMGGNDTMDGGAGDDVLLDLNGDNVFQDTLGNNYMAGGAGNDRMYGGAGMDTMRPGAGNDHVEGGGGRDNINGGAGNDTVLGQDGDDLLLGGAGRDLISGGAGDDMIFGGTEDDSLAGDDGNDVIYGEQGADTLSGGAGNDTLRGGPGSDRLYGGDGNDRLFGGTESDTLEGGGGDDQLIGEGGNDLLRGGDGNDTLDGSWEDDEIYGDAGDDLLIGGHGHDRLYGGTGRDELRGGDGNDTARGGEDDDQLFGGAGDDDLGGEAGDDVLSGMDGNDILDGGEGDDRLIGGAGVDRLTGGAGADVFVFSAFDSSAGAPDVVTDFATGIDRIDLSGLKLVAIGGQEFSGSGIELRWSAGEGGTRIEADLDGNGTADLVILLEGASSVTHGDFIL
jgi:Ca2+-binding RTX toxin-like protein